MESALEIAWVVWVVMGAGLAFMVALALAGQMFKWSIMLYDWIKTGEIPHM